MTEIDRILDQMQRSFNGDAWHGPSLLSLLDNIDPAKAAAAPLPECHSIWELTEHLITWISTVTRRNAGELAIPDEHQNFPRIDQRDYAAWQNTLQRLNKAHTILLEKVRELHEAELNLIHPGQTFSVYQLLHGTIQHNLYHAGQIALLQKL